MQSGFSEPVRVLRKAAWLWVGYLASLAVMDLFIYAGRPMQPVIWYHLINAAPALVFLGLAYSSWVKTNLSAILPVMILLISLIPILFNHWFDLRLPPAPLSNVEGMTMRQLPVLFIGLVLVAWYYDLAAVLLYSIGTNLFELAIVQLFGPFDPERLTIFYFLTIIRTISFIVVGIFFTQLITRLRLQQEALRSANCELAHHASTLENLAVSRERNRLARELHDTLAHTLSGLTVQLDTVKAYWDVKPETARQLLTQALAATRSGLDETRRAVKALRASSLEDLGMLEALRKLSESAADRGKLCLEMTLPKQIPLLSPDVEQCIYRVAQEALENVVHHAAAKKLAVKLSLNTADIRLIVADDGLGMDVARAEKAGHFGLAGMRERAQLVGGELQVSSKPNQGTCVQLEIKGYPPHESDYL